MIRSAPDTVEGERERQQECVKEPLHIPGAIQPYGVLLTMDPTTFEVVQVSENCAAVLGADVQAVLGQSLDALVGPAAAGELRDVLAGTGTAVNPVVVDVGGRRCDAIIHRSSGLVVLEFEPAGDPVAGGPIPAIYAAIQRLSACESVEELRAATAFEIRRVTGYDHVMLYHFHPDGHGEIVGEDVVDGAHSYLGLHFPASDIPSQARRLYLGKASHMIVTSEYAPAHLIPAANPRTGQPIDLSAAVLRSVSPHHLHFMRNMGQAATLSLSLVFDGALIGMVTCSHRTPHRVPYIYRQAFEILAKQVALQLSAMTEIERLKRQLQIHSIREQLVERLVTGEAPVQALLQGSPTILDLLPANGVVVSLDRQTFSLGDAPSAASAAAAVDLLAADWSRLPFVSDSLGVDHAALARIVPSCAGLVMLPFGGRGGYVTWFRGEVAQGVNWLGDQSPDNRDTPLSPRNSFSQWRSSVSGRSLPWDALELEETKELLRDLDSALLRRAESKLAHLGFHDPLTGLPNRRWLMDRLDGLLALGTNSPSIAVLFIDLDKFKLVNDSLGHEIGDLVLVASGERIVSAIRGQDRVARLGGDEFIVVCSDADAARARVVADRIVHAFRRPFDLAGQHVVMTVSVGVSAAGIGVKAADVLREADAAMYRAKQGGGNQTMR
ncbi:hypothetical protein GY21_07480 [Cryobacterium roopkundense]|uniref:Uncharacterized protein n=1 Tax=Cryobacterium roopkundense TaxID=1001240 RepID=A0A099JIT8_9MICO|nr:sensor domain-containing diguanylate cyclase [Cryobacterium roopkundense]KGJ77537.1 hypothetical protein GY21_07480 [Cryobacterium roopkundense]